jgi:hypothetical protein
VISGEQDKQDKQPIIAPAAVVGAVADVFADGSSFGDVCAGKRDVRR